MLAHPSHPAPLLGARELPQWAITSILHSIRVFGLTAAWGVGLISLFSTPPTAVPAIAMLAAAVMFTGAAVMDEDGMMTVRALGLLAVAAFARAVGIAIFLDRVPRNNQMVAFVIWLWISIICFVLIRMLIRWGIVVRPPNRRW